MELVLATVAVGAVPFFGGLIRAGNERERKAIDDLGQQSELWSVQALRLKRERVAREVRMDDALGWLRRLVAKVCGHDMNLRVTRRSTSQGLS